MSPSFQLPITFSSLSFKPSPTASLRAVSLQLAVSLSPCDLLPLPAPKVTACVIIAAPHL